MASKATLDRISCAIDQLAVATGVRSALTVIAVPSSMAEAAVTARHYQIHKRDRQAKLTVMVTRFGEASPSVELMPFEDPKIRQAWRELAREVRPLAFWDVPPDALPL